ncbi:MAG: 30S ribosomal protein THX [Bacteroidales bacterium]
MGKGDKRSKRGKIILGSYGVSRAKRKKKYIPVAKPEVAVKEKKEKAVKVVVEEPIAVVTEVVPETENVVGEVAETPAKKKTVKTTKKTKSSEPELDLNVDEKPADVENPETTTEV